jgi:hypothetical protein
MDTKYSQMLLTLNDDLEKKEHHSVNIRELGGSIIYCCFHKSWPRSHFDDTIKI